MARKAAEESNRLKTEFLASMSHEIRTPLNAILGMTYLALKADPGSRIRDYLQHIQSGSKSLLGIVDDILDFSKVEAGRLELEQAEMRLDDVLESVTLILSGKSSEKGLQLLIEVASEVPLVVVGDSLRLKQVLLNLVGNAIKFTENGEVALAVRVGLYSWPRLGRSWSTRFVRPKACFGNPSPAQACLTSSSTSWAAQIEARSPDPGNRYDGGEGGAGPGRRGQPHQPAHRSGTVGAGRVAGGCVGRRSAGR